MGNNRAIRVLEDADIDRHSAHLQPLRVRDLTTRERRNLANVLRWRAEDAGRRNGKATEREYREAVAKA